MWSRPTGARGLKSEQTNKAYVFPLQSRPTGARGLKFDGAGRYSDNDCVASHRGAWIEIFVMFNILS